MSYGIQPELDAQAWLAKVSSEGELIWELGFGDEGEDSFSDIQLLGDGSVALTGSYFSTELDYTQAWLINCDSDGNVIWELKPEDLESEGMDVTLHNDIIHLQLRQIEEGEWIFTNAAYSSDGTELFFNNYIPQGSNWYHDAVPFNSDEIALLGTSNYYGNGGLETKYDVVNDAGELTIKATYGGFEDDVATDLVLAQNGLIYICGYTESYNVDSRDYFVLYSTNNSETVNEVIREIKVEDELITGNYELENDRLPRVYPNPCRSFCSILADHYPLDINIYNSKGTLLLKEQLISPILSLPDLPEGIYIFEFVDQEAIYREKVVIAN
jgi:hypothetical protein